MNLRNGCNVNNIKYRPYSILVPTLLKVLGSLLQLRLFYAATVLSDQIQAEVESEVPKGLNIQKPMPDKQILMTAAYK